MHRILWPPMLTPTWSGSAASLPQLPNHMAICSSRVAPGRRVSLAHGRRSRLASNAHSLEQYLPAFRPVPRFRNGFWQHRHCRCLARFLFLSTVSAAITKLEHGLLQNLLLGFGCRKSFPQHSHGLIAWRSGYLHLSLQYFEFLNRTNLSPQARHVRTCVGFFCFCSLRQSSEHMVRQRPTFAALCGMSLPQTVHATTDGFGGREAARQQAAEQYVLGLKPRDSGTEPPQTGQLLPSLAFSPASPRTATVYQERQFSPNRRIKSATSELGRPTGAHGTQDMRSALRTPLAGNPPIEG